MVSIVVRLAKHTLPAAWTFVGYGGGLGGAVQPKPQPVEDIAAQNDFFTAVAKQRDAW